MLRPTSFSFLAASASALALAACGAADIGPGSPAYGTGSLGNGGFVYVCDDSVECGPSNGAKTFPDAVALSSTFTLRYVPRDSNASNPGQGITVGAVGNAFFEPTTSNALLAKKEGAPAVVARDQAGSVVEFKTLLVRKPDALAIFGSTASPPVPLTSVTLSVGDVVRYRASPRAKGQELAGVLRYAWSTDSPDLLRLDANATGGVSVTAMKAGNATLTVSGGTLTAPLVVVIQ